MAAVAVTVDMSMRIVAFVSLKPANKLVQWKYASYLVEVRSNDSITELQ